MLTGPPTKPCAAALIAGTSVLVADFTVGAEFTDFVVKTMRLYLSANVVAPADVDLAHPSGTVTLKPGPEKGTNAWLSGMSPGGCTSTTAEDDAGFVVEFDVVCCGAPLMTLEVGGDDDCGDEPGAVDDEQPPIAVVTASVTASAAVALTALCDRMILPGSRSR